jgi:hypothetical protein
MRTDLYEREPGRTYVYVKFRCRRCKRMGQTFVPENRWDWSVLEPARDELNDVERDRLHEAGPISDAELVDFCLRLKNIHNLGDLTGETRKSEPQDSQKDTPPEAREGKNRDSARDANRDTTNRDTRRDGKNHNAGGRDARLNLNEGRPDDLSAGS